jgi:phosphoenolpyruvate carboxylase
MATSTSAPWTELETYRTLLQELEKRNAAYTKELAEFQEAEAAGKGDPAVKERLAKEYVEITELYGRLSGIRHSLAQTRDSR